ncbi:MAG TPA: PsbP-related protein [Egibacteraceae bacterium]|jgi:hypothetical protein|nr:PsbP-related protein [Egibacteraceae bacterium]
MRRVLILFGVAFVAGLVAVVAATAGERLITGPDVAGPPDTSTAGDGEAFASFTDERTGFSLSYPADWRRVPVGSPAVRLLVAPPDGDDSILVRVVTLEADVTGDDLPAVRTFTDQLVREGETVEVLGDPTRVEIGGLPGIQYLYTFEDAESGRQGVHSHYFLFDGSTMYTIVLQALPVERFAELAPAFRVVIDSFEVST